MLYNLSPWPGSCRSCWTHRFGRYSRADPNCMRRRKPWRWCMRGRRLRRSSWAATEGACVCSLGTRLCWSSWCWTGGCCSAGSPRAPYRWTRTCLVSVEPVGSWTAGLSGWWIRLGMSCSACLASAYRWMCCTGFCTTGRRTWRLCSAETAPSCCRMEDTVSLLTSRAWRMLAIAMPLRGGASSLLNPLEGEKNGASSFFTVIQQHARNQWSHSLNTYTVTLADFNDSTLSVLFIYCYSWTPIINLWVNGQIGP